MSIAMHAKQAFTSFSNIRVLPSGYQVSIVRAKNEFSRHFAGHTPESLRKARSFRDRLLRELPAKRLNEIPKRVLGAAKVAIAVVGVFRNPDRKLYQVSYRDRKGQICSKAFSWSKIGEAAAYLKAVKFRKGTIRGRS